MVRCFAPPSAQLWFGCPAGTDGSQAATDFKWWAKSIEASHSDSLSFHSPPHLISSHSHSPSLLISSHCPSPLLSLSSPSKVGQERRDRQQGQGAVGRDGVAAAGDGRKRSGPHRANILGRDLATHARILNVTSVPPSRLECLLNVSEGPCRSSFASDQTVGGLAALSDKEGEVQAYLILNLRKEGAAEKKDAAASKSGGCCSVQ